jgi:hypothetical protein
VKRSCAPSGRPLGGTAPGCQQATCQGRSSRSARTPRRPGGRSRWGRSRGSRPARAGRRSPSGRGRRSACPARTPPGGHAGARRACCCPSAVGADQDRLGGCGCGQLRQREVDQLGQVGGGPGRGVAGPQDPGQRLTRRLASVQVGQQRAEPEGVLIRCLRRLAWHRFWPAPRSRPRPPPAAGGLGGRRPPTHERGHAPWQPAAPRARRGPGPPAR